MTPERWQKVGEVFHQALDLPAEKRREWIDGSCAGDAELRAEVLSLLGSDAIAVDGYLEKRVQPVVASWLEPAGPPARVGPYRLLRELGRGGMGTVYLAERDDDEYQVQVAIKLVRRGMDTDVILQRFYRERQTLARLQHPNIARLLDGGTTADGRPYIVMEYVDGERITRYCEERRLSVAAKLRLFLSVCKAVGYAHRHFVVHRDLKPGNILVDGSGDVKLLDFGICKLLHAQAAGSDETVDIGLVALTPDYASPEQIRGDPITVASDVYSLAAVLYELLTTVKPHKIEDPSLRAMERAICEAPVPRASLACPDKAVARQLQGDLDNILHVALDKDPQRRYASVDHFAEDIRRHLDDEPVGARPDSVSYRVGKFVRRRKALVAAAATVLITLAAGVVVSARSARVANENLRLVRQISNAFLLDVHDAIQYLPGATKARELIVQTGQQYLEKLSKSAADDHDFQHELAAAYRRIGDLQGDVMNANVGNPKAALANYEKSLTLLDGVLRQRPAHPLAVAEQVLVHRRIGNLQDYANQWDAAQKTFTEGTRIAEDYLQRRPGDDGIRLQLAELAIASGNSHRRRLKTTEARQAYTQAAQLLEELDRRKPGDRQIQMSLASAYSGRGLCETRLGRYHESLAVFRRVAAIREDLLKRDPNNVLTRRNLMFAYSHLGDLLGNPNLINLGDTAGAVAAYRRVLEIARKVHEDDPADHRARGDYAIALSRMAVVLPPDQVRQRIELLQRALQLQRELAAVNPQDLFVGSERAANHLFLGDAYMASGDVRAAAAAYRQGVQLTEALLPNVSAVIARVMLRLYGKLGTLLAQRGDRAGALALRDKALRLIQADTPASRNWTAQSTALLQAVSDANAGHITASLARSPAPAVSDAADARQWLQRALHRYRALENRPTTTADDRREKRAIETDLEKLK
jgi:eukaryotic-like serine/threonine-protein kinase